MQSCSFGIHTLSYVSLVRNGGREMAIRTKGHLNMILNSVTITGLGSFHAHQNLTADGIKLETIPSSLRKDSSQLREKRDNSIKDQAD